jgi:polysaccharide biosynthesis/export protein
MKLLYKLYIGIAVLFLLVSPAAYAEEANSTLVIDLGSVPAVQPIVNSTSASTPELKVQPATSMFDPLSYTLGANDIVEVVVLRHPEFSGIYPINQDGSLQYKFVGDINVSGMTKKQLEDKIREVIAAYVIAPEVSVTITEYKSKVIYVLGEVSQPGKYYMRSEKMSVRDAVVQAGLPTLAAAMRKARIITPDKGGKVKMRNEDLYSIIYGGNLKINYDMKPGDILYVPSTVMAKLIRVINPITSTVQGATNLPAAVATGKTSTVTMAQ